MAVKNLENPIFKYDDPATGAPLDGGLVNVYAAGTTTRVNTWQDSAQTTLNANPVVLDSQGEAKIWFDQDVKVVVTDSTGTTTYYTFDNVSPIGGTISITAASNLLLNGSFEADNAANEPTNWTQSLIDSSATIQTSTADVNHGLQSCLFTGVAGGAGSVCGSITSEKFNVAPGETFDITFDYKANSANTEHDVSIFWYQSDDTASATPETALTLPANGASPTTWTAFEEQATAPSDATRAEIKITGVNSNSTHTAGTVYFDNVAVSLGSVDYLTYPAFKAYRLAGGYTHTSGNIVQFDGEIFDNNADYDTTTYRFTPTSEGVYIFHTQVRATVSAAGTTTVRINHSVDGVIQEHRVANTAGQDLTVQATAIVEMNGTTDYVYVTFFGGGTLTVSNAEERTNFSGSRLPG